MIQVTIEGLVVLFFLALFAVLLIGPVIAQGIAFCAHVWLRKRQ